MENILASLYYEDRLMEKIKCFAPTEDEANSETKDSAKISHQISK